MKEELAAMDLEYKRLVVLFLSTVIVFSAYALAVVIAPLTLYQRGIAIFFTAAPLGLFLYHVWNKMRSLEERVKQI